MLETTSHTPTLPKPPKPSPSSATKQDSRSRCMLHQVTVYMQFGRFVMNLTLIHGEVTPAASSVSVKYRDWKLTRHVRVTWRRSYEHQEPIIGSSGAA